MCNGYTVKTKEHVTSANEEREEASAKVRGEAKGREREQGERRGGGKQMMKIYIYWVLTKKVAKKIRLYVAQEI